MSYTTITACRSCGSTELVDLFSLGNQFVSDFVDQEHISTGPRCPIDIALCPACTLVQAKHTPPPEQLYQRHYWYHSSTTQTMREALADVARTAERVAKLEIGDIVLDIGSNDGTLLRSYTTPGIVRVGVEPADNMWQYYDDSIYLVSNFWGAEGIAEYTIQCHGQAKVITALGMLYDLDNPNTFIADVAKVLHSEGVFIAQLMCLKQMLEKKDIGNAAHEHLEFYSLRSLSLLFQAHGLEIFNIEENSVNGGSYRLFVRHVNYLKPKTLAHDFAFRHEEEHMRLNDLATYTSFFQEIEQGREKVVRFIWRVVAEGKRCWIYGSSTKGNVITQYYGLDSSLITAAADRSPEKWGKYMVGSGIPIVRESIFRQATPEYALVLPYAFLDEFVSRESSWLSEGGQFIVPLPEPRLVGSVGGRIVYESL